MNINEITMGMTPQEKKAYFSHMEKCHREEAEKIRAERDANMAYKNSLIDDILKRKPNHDRESLKKYSIRTLEIMADTKK